MKLQGRIALVTGAARGIGLACVKRLVADGATVVGCDLNAEEGKPALEAAGATFVSCDVGDKAAVDAMVDAVVAEHGSLDILVANAALIHKANFLEISEEDFDRVLRVNLKGVFLCGQAAGRQMVKQGKGAIVNMSSINGTVAIPDQVPYVTAKGGVEQMTKLMALAMAHDGVRVNAVAPGTILTEMAKTIMTDDAVRRMILSRTPIGRTGDPSEIASVVSFLASDDASYVTGETIVADGGRLALNYVMPVKE
ncbi:MAG: 3-oxoacyl-ACP reductase FabG [Alphaproteobacteria bacterium]|nr:3-oxoacyl-ACP reductase FabG [Alphaproteobacteria bacterium]